MAARRAGQKVFDWAKLNSVLPDYLRGDFLKFRGNYETCRARMNAYSEKPEPINWELYKKGISKPGLVESFQKQYEALQVPYPPDTSSATIAEQEKKTEIEALEAIQKAKLKAEELRKELAKVRAQKPFEEMTIDEYLADKPEIRRQVEEDTKNHIWYMGKE